MTFDEAEAKFKRLSSIFWGRGIVRRNCIVCDGGVDPGDMVCNNPDCNTKLLARVSALEDENIDRARERYREEDDGA